MSKKSEVTAYIPSRRLLSALDASVEAGNAFDRALAKRTGRDEVLQRELKAELKRTKLTRRQLHSGIYAAKKVEKGDKEYDRIAKAISRAWQFGAASSDERIVIPREVLKAAKLFVAVCEKYTDGAVGKVARTALARAL